MTTPHEDLKTIEIEPALSATRSVIWLHGLGADGNDFVPIVSEMRLPSNLNLRFIFPHAPMLPITINNGFVMRAWYDITSIDINSRVDELNIKKSIQIVERLVKKEMSRGIPAQNIILGGFSQGAVMALLTGLQFKSELAGIIALSGYLPPLERFNETQSKANLHTRIFLAHGTQDPIVPYALGVAAYETLKAEGYPTTWHSYPIGHSASLEEIQDIKAWIIELFK